MHPITALSAILLAAPAVNAGMYPKSSAVLQVEAKTYDKLIAKSNHTSIVEFYAPWCGHCQNLKPAYEKAAQNLAGLATVAAIDCDDDANKPLCGTMGIQGFPTLKIIRPGKKTGRPMVEDYKGERSAAGIVNAVTANINNHVTRVTDKDLAQFLGDGEKPRALLFSEKGTTGTMLKSLAIDFLGQVVVGQVRSKEKATVEKYGITKFPTLVLVPAGSGEPVVYEGEMKKENMAEFLGTVAQANADAGGWVSIKGKKPKSEKKEKTEKKEKPKKMKKTEETEKKEKEEEKEETKQTQTQDMPVLPTPLASPKDTHAACFLPTSPTCVLVLTSTSATPATLVSAFESLEAIDPAWKWSIYALGLSNPASASLASILGTETDSQAESAESGSPETTPKATGISIVVVNSKRRWFAKYQDALTEKNVRSFMEAVRAGAWKREELPEIGVAELGGVVEKGHDEL
ncbi:hypothetical protein TD95_002908 [Thielaviopsis punctulata]|uniref:protein disulfide-isomerase n=1 Tax=Thielaviopsis punctulata TaxID=72032 RepID=A0A0F4ZEL8_9PEZI|nr:hypothetical protein TD95_002908 [Thielaviopsis punctulata]